MTVRPRFLIALLIAISLMLVVSGCATVDPGRMFPSEHSSRIAEGAWLALDAIDTAQTVQIARNPTCYREANPVAASLYGDDHPEAGRVALTNVVLALVHSRVSRWLDDHVAYATSHEENAGPWYVGRIAWHVVSIAGTGAAVANNFNRGLTPTSARCP